MYLTFLVSTIHFSFTILISGSWGVSITGLVVIGSLSFGCRLVARFWSGRCFGLAWSLWFRSGSRVIARGGLRISKELLLDITPSCSGGSAVFEAKLFSQPIVIDLSSRWSA